MFPIITKQGKISAFWFYLAVFLTSSLLIFAASVKDHRIPFETQVSNVLIECARLKFNFETTEEQELITQECAELGVKIINIYDHSYLIPHHQKEK